VFDELNVVRSGRWYADLTHLRTWRARHLEVYKGTKAKIVVACMGGPNKDLALYGKTLHKGGHGLILRNNHNISWVIK
jgi:hypothetical protein